MGLSSADFVTGNTGEGTVAPVEEMLVTGTPKDNIKGVATAGWVLAFLFPFVGMFLNFWLLKHGEGQVNKKFVVAAYVISIVCSVALLVGVFGVLWAFAFPTLTTPQ